MRDLSPDGRFEIHSHRRDDDSYMCSDTDYSWWVSLVETGDEIASFSGRSYQRASGTSESGVSGVRFDGGAILASRFGGGVERIELPTSWRLGEGGSDITLVWADGRSETRERHAVLAVGKFGDVFALTELKKLV